MLCKKICTMSSVLFIYVTTVCLPESNKNPLFENQNELEAPSDVCLYLQEISLWLGGRIY